MNTEEVGRGQEGARLLVVESDEEARGVLCEILRQAGYGARAVGSAQEALEELEGCSFSAVITDLKLPDLGGAEFIQRMRGRGIMTPALVLSGCAGCLEISALRSKGAQEVLPKPLRIASFLKTVHGLVGQSLANSP